MKDGKAALAAFSSLAIHVPCLFFAASAGAGLLVLPFLAGLPLLGYAYWRAFGCLRSCWRGEERPGLMLGFALSLVILATLTFLYLGTAHYLGTGHPHHHGALSPSAPLFMYRKSA
jgi:hypothetical protein